MQIVRGWENWPSDKSAGVVSIGNFDGVHLGHQTVITQLKKVAEKLKQPVTILLFEPQPAEYFGNVYAPPKRLSSLRDKLRLLHDMKIDTVIVQRFNVVFACMLAETFIEVVLVKTLKLKHLVVGNDFQFGWQRLGDYAMLEAASRQFDFGLNHMETYFYQGARVSSTWVRLALSEGKFTQVKKLLGRDYSITGRVLHGDKRGRLLGFPTLNIRLKHVVPVVHGVYAVTVKLLNAACSTELYYGVANFGVRPTVDGVRRLLEVHLFDFNQDWYGQMIEVIFHHQIRSEYKFDSLELLQQQIGRDVVDAKNFFLSWDYF